MRKVIFVLALTMLYCRYGFAAVVVDTTIPRLPAGISCPFSAELAQGVVVTDAYMYWARSDPDYLSQVGHVTSHGSQAYSHQHALKDFTCQGYLSNGTIVSLTKFSVGAFYLCYWGLDPNIVVLSPASMAQNCHGYTTGLGSWITTDLTGIGVVVNYDYQQSSLSPDNRYAFSQPSSLGNVSHSYKIDFSCVASGGITICYPTSMSEKSNASPIIRRATTTFPGSFVRHIQKP